MRKFICATIGLGMVFAASNAIAAMYTETFAGKDKIHEGQSKIFVFDMWYDESSPKNLGGTNSSLDLIEDAYGAFDEWVSADLAVTVKSDRDFDTEKITIKFDAWWDGDGATTLLQTNSFQLASSSPTTYDFELTDPLFSAFETYGLGTVKITASYDCKFCNHNDFFIKEVGMTVETVPEPTTMLMFGAGVAGLAGVARRRRK